LRTYRRHVRAVRSEPAIVHAVRTNRWRGLPEYRPWLDAASANPDRLYHASRDNAHGQAVGVAVYRNFVPAMGTIGIGGLVFSPRLQRRPAATEAMFLIMRRVFEVQIGLPAFRRADVDLGPRPRRSAVEIGPGKFI
jgi:RimJ/RimL family protein N-acetyltransferase